MNGYCNMCGKCCEAITLNIAPEELANHRKRNPKEDGTEGDYAFASIHFHPISNEEAFKRNSVHRLHVESGMFNGIHFYECDMYDQETHKCTAHESRPNVCRNYPYYGRDLSYGEWFYDPDCPYIDDAPPTTKQRWMAIKEELRKVD